MSELKTTKTACPNAKYSWHKVDGYCKACHPERKESDDVIQARRNAKGYK